MSKNKEDPLAKSRAERAEHANQRIQEIAEYVLASDPIDTDLTLEALGKKFGYTPPALSVAFERVKAMTYSDFCAENGINTDPKLRRLRQKARSVLEYMRMADLSQDDMSQGTVCEKFDISVSALRRVFGDVSGGVKYEEMLNIVRFDRAKTLIIEAFKNNNPYNAKEVMNAIGLQRKRYREIFQRFAGKTPLEFSKELEALDEKFEKIIKKLENDFKPEGVCKPFLDAHIEEFMEENEASVTREFGLGTDSVLTEEVFLIALKSRWLAYQNAPEKIQKSKVKRSAGGGWSKSGWLSEDLIIS